MDVLNFSSFAKSIKKGMAKPTNIGITKLLLRFIVGHESVLNTEGQPYNISNYYTNRWWNQHEDIPEPIKKAAASPEIKALAVTYFESEVILKLSPQKEADTYSALLDLIDSDTELAAETRKAFLSHYDKNEMALFLCDTFLYAVQKNNKATNIETNTQIETKVTIEEDIRKLGDLLQRLPKPIQLIPPEDLEEHEMIYISELLAAYSEHEGVRITNKDALVSYPKYKRNFDRQRKDYFAAESVRQFSRDTLTFNKTDEFKVLKDETYNGIIDVCEDEYSSGFTRLNGVMKHVTTIQLNKSLLTKLPGYVSNSEKKGICHLLVNDGDIKWAVDNE